MNAVNVPSVTGEILKRLGPFLSLADQMGSLQVQLIKGPIKEVIIEYRGDFLGLDLSAITTSVLKGLLDSIAKDDINFVNAPVIAKEMGITVTEKEIPRCSGISQSHYGGDCYDANDIHGIRYYIWKKSGASGANQFLPA